MLITQEIKKRFEENLEWAQGIDIASAWATLPDSSLTQIMEGKTVRSIIGITGVGTSPEALRKLREIGKLRIVQPDKPLFHPKVYIFKSRDESAAWIGSANFTGGGFERNEEVLVEIKDKRSIEVIEEWFNDKWMELSRDATSGDIDNYENLYHHRQHNPVSSNRPSELIRNVSDWAGFVRALEKCDERWISRNNKNNEGWSVLGKIRNGRLGKSRSYIHTIKRGHEIMNEFNDLGFILKGQVNILFGPSSADGEWSLLGDMRHASALAKKAFWKNGDYSGVRDTMRDAIGKVMDARDDEFPSVAIKAFTEIKKIDGVGKGTATRLLTLARPDRCVSVNRASEEGLAEVFGLPRDSLEKEENYRKLLNNIYQKPWFTAPKPRDEDEQTIWGMRVALIDSFVYRFPGLPE